MAKNSQSNKNIIQINNLVKMAEEKKHRKRRAPQREQMAEQAAETQMQQQAPQIFQTLDTPQLRDVINEAVNSRAMQINDMQKQTREARIAAQAAARDIADINTQKDQPLNQGDSPDAEDSVRRGVKLTEPAQSTFGENEDEGIKVSGGNSGISQQQQNFWLPPSIANNPIFFNKDGSLKKRMGSDIRLEFNKEMTNAGLSNMPIEKLLEKNVKYKQGMQEDKILKMQGGFYKQFVSANKQEQPQFVETGASTGFI